MLLRGSVGSIPPQIFNKKQSIGYSWREKLPLREEAVKTLTATGLTVLQV